jgi:hypothetical protein
MVHIYIYIRLDFWKEKPGHTLRREGRWESRNGGEQRGTDLHAFFKIKNKKKDHVSGSFIVVVVVLRLLPLL